MTREEILVMHPGPELDTLIAEKVMNGERKSLISYAPKPKEYWVFSESNQPWVDEWKPSTDISAAWEVVEKISETWEVKIFNRSGWTCYISTSLDMGYNFRATGDTTPEAICKAALLAITDA